jgi:hypothetical protein
MVSRLGPRQRLQSPQAFRKVVISMVGMESAECVIVISAPHTLPTPATASPLSARVLGLPERSEGGVRYDRLEVRRIEDDDVEPLFFLGCFLVGANLVTSDGSRHDGTLLPSFSLGAFEGDWRVVRLRLSTLGAVAHADLCGARWSRRRGHVGRGWGEHSQQNIPNPSGSRRLLLLRQRGEERLHAS